MIKEAAFDAVKRNEGKVAADEVDAGSEGRE